MAERRPKRKLAAILSADVAGYARLMADDEAATVETLQKYRAAIARVILQHDGRVINAPGDNILAEFPSAVEAVQAVVEIQKDVEGRNAELPESRRMHFRAGVNLGDVIAEEDGTVYGDGVNVAARLEALAEPGGIAVSEAVHMQVKAKLDCGFDFLGEQQVKNIAEPVRVYRVLPEGGKVARAAGAPHKARPASARLIGIIAAMAVLVAGIAVWQLPDEPTAVETAGDPQGDLDDPVFATPKGPSIAVLPFTNMSDDPDQEYFADGMTEQIISELARFRGLFVIARNSTFQYKGQSPDIRVVARDLGVSYVLEGSVRRAANTVRVTTQLLDGSSASHLWAETYDRELTAENIFRIQDEISEQVVATIASHSGILSRTDRWRANNSATSSLEAYKCVLLAQDFPQVLTAEAYFVVRDCLEQMVEVDPSYTDAWAWLSYVYNFEYSYDFNPQPDSLERGLEAAQQAIRLDPSNQMAHFAMAVSLFFQHKLDEFRGAAETAIELNPNNADVIAELAKMMAYTGQWDRGVALMRKAMALNPMHPGWYWYPVAKLHLINGEFDDAIAAAQKINSPDNFVYYCVLAYVYTHAGRQAQAEEAVASALTVNPDATIALMAKLYRRWNFQPDFISNYMIAGLRMAGMPEGRATD